jgi:hypothetical protein
MTAVSLFWMSYLACDKCDLIGKDISNSDSAITQLRGKQFKGSMWLVSCSVREWVQKSGGSSGNRPSGFKYMKGRLLTYSCNTEPISYRKI